MQPVDGSLVIIRNRITEIHRLSGLVSPVEWRRIYCQGRLDYASLAIVIILKLERESATVSQVSAANPDIIGSACKSAERRA